MDQTDTPTPRKRKYKRSAPSEAALKRKQETLKRNEERLLAEIVERTAGEYEPVLAGSHVKKSRVLSDRKGHGIPKRVEALFVLLTDYKMRDRRLPLTLFELETNPRTKNLPKEDKDALIRHWPDFKDDVERTLALQAERDATVRLALKADVEAKKIIKANGLDALKISDQLDSTAKIYNNQIFKTALAIGASDTDETLANPMLKELDENRRKRLKDLIHISRNLVDLAARIRVTDDSTVAQGELSDSAAQMLADADAMLIQRGIVIDVSAHDEEA